MARIKLRILKDQNHRKNHRDLEMLAIFKEIYPLICICILLEVYCYDIEWKNIKTCFI